MVRYLTPAQHALPPDAAPLRFAAQVKRQPSNNPPPFLIASFESFLHGLFCQIHTGSLFQRLDERLSVLERADHVLLGYVQRNALVLLLRPG